MRVLLISHTCQSRTEGQPKAALLAQHPGIELKVLTPERWMHYGQWRAAQTPLDNAFDCEIGKVCWPWAGDRIGFYMHWYPGMAQLLRDFQPDIIDLWEEPWAQVSVQACKLRNRLLPNTRIVAETEQNINKKLPPPFEPYRSFTLQQANFVIGRNREAIEIVRSKGYRGPAEVVPNAVDAELFRPMDRAECRRELGIAGFVAGYVGRIVEEKGLMEMVDALALCPSHFRLLFVGSGAYQSELERRVREMGKEDQVTFLPGRPLEQLPQVMNALDVLVLPSRTTPSWKEQFGRVLIEANACGTPVIGSTSGAIPEVVGKAGVVVPERNSKALADALRDLEADPAGCAAMGKIGRRQVEENYTWQRVAERMSGIYQKVMQSG
ncbi:MAG: glycosyltransferase family 4 protein [Chthonomonadaceae bacterium]|nr:glycosyltransferase family 4 protein [Chthonomonadaceae bacterium]